MTQEEKQLLLKDLCARLPYNVIVEKDGRKCPVLSITNDGEVEIEIGFRYFRYYDVQDVRPYLRPMSSMTEEEIDRMWEIYDSGPAAESSVAVAEYLYERNIDCHHLIEKGLALEAPDGMYK